MEMANNQVEIGIEVTVEVSLSNTENCEEICTMISPDATTILPGVKELLIRTQLLARGMMFQKLADKFTETGRSGVFRGSKNEILQAYAVISVPGGTVDIITGKEINLLPTDVAETTVFEHEKIEQVKKKLVMQLLEDFAVQGGQCHGSPKYS